MFLHLMTRCYAIEVSDEPGERGPEQGNEDLGDDDDADFLSDLFPRLHANAPPEQLHEHVVFEDDGMEMIDALDQAFFGDNGDAAADADLMFDPEDVEAVVQYDEPQEDLFGDLSDGSSSSSSLYTPCGNIEESGADRPAGSSAHPASSFAHPAPAGPPPPELGTILSPSRLLLRDPSTIDVRLYPDHKIWEAQGGRKIQCLGAARKLGFSSQVKLECALHKDRCSFY